jgi:ATP phosphoribosyltransferase regulatory subunit
MRAVPPPLPPRRVFLPLGVDVSVGRRLREAGWVTVAGLAPVADPEAEARRLKCSHVAVGGEPSELV